MQYCRGLRVGYIPYLNCVPFFHYLAELGFSGSIITGVPTALNHMLQIGEIDISPSSSFEYGQNYHDYVLLPGHSISACGPVKSVLLFSPCPLDKLQNYKIAVTGDSATSINLLRILLREYVGIRRVDDFVPTTAVESLIAEKKPGLLIGDRAMVQAMNLPEGMHCFDLGELWLYYTGLPFVFALWILRRQSVQRLKSEVLDLQRLLGESIGKALGDLAGLALKHGASPEELPFLVNYWQTIDYSLSPKHLQGLELYYRLCLKYKYLTDSPAIEFFQG
ncbi:menaquinone biosynthetic enzyme MqnA/MqnD family protein [Geopsychrobacter electrodiphilus]|uniref:menaquinone biosynthetic enzyme MqnA/MqnD family protein n=1 Tax=Geopsychrobacter electrodiphilus TaxID=225196 RepID=UPI001FE0E2EC|nr:menaquinone biosynthesis protein [Geopsychrobacter electrodiphilus]